MLIELDPPAFCVVSPLFEALRIHLAIDSVMNGATPARLFTDDATSPNCALIWYGHRILLAGDPDHQSSGAAAADFIASVVIPHELGRGNHWLSLYYEPDQWAESIEHDLLPGKSYHRALRQYYACDTRLPDTVDAFSEVPAGMSLQRVDAKLVGNHALINLDTLKEEMCSERPSVDNFLARSFGVCLIQNSELIGWCLSEYNSADRCAIGIETREPFQRRGLGTLMTRAMVQIARSASIREVGWHCWASNVASGKTALKAGFHHVCNYQSHLIRIKE